jgi:DNA-binding transcriptional MerR regulator
LAESGKSDSAFRTISEVSEDLHVPQHVLRFWETKFSAIKPLKRGGNRRYYRPEDIQLLRAINTLLYIDGYTIRGVQKLLRDQGVRAIAAAKGGALPTGETSKPENFAFQAAASAQPQASGESDAIIDQAPINQPALEFEPDPSITNVGLFPLPAKPASIAMPVIEAPPPEANHDDLMRDAIARLESVRDRIKNTLE